MTEIEKFDAVNKWQKTKSVHSLACYNGHTMTPRINTNDMCILTCEICASTQDWIPDIVFSIDDIEKTMSDINTCVQTMTKSQMDKDTSF